MPRNVVEAAAVPLSHKQLPAFFEAADTYAGKWARRFTLLQSSQLVLLVIAALGGATAWHVGTVEASAWLSVAALAAGDDP